MTFVVRTAGIQTTVQDLGRPMWQHLGVPVGGAMDAHAHRVANLLVGNDDAHPTLECTLGGVALQFQVPSLVALAGRDVTASVDGRPVPPWRPFRVAADALLVLHTGVRTTIACAGGIDVPVVLDGRGTSLRAAFGGFSGRALRKDDQLALGTPTALGARILAGLIAQDRHVADWGISASLRPPYHAAPVVHLIPGPELALLTAASRADLFGATFRIAPESDRMGFRLTGPLLSLSAQIEMLSSGVTAGTIQLPPGGAPIVLMADRQTTGGYPRLGEVVAVDLPLLAQLRPGDHVRFATTTLDEAHARYHARERDLARAATAIALRATGGAR